MLSGNLFLKIKYRKEIILKHCDDTITPFSTLVKQLLHEKGILK